MAEKRVVSETGGEKGQKDARFGGCDPRAMKELALIYGFGEEKYARYNYLKGYPWSLSIDALFRHLFAFLDGEDLDPESGLHHTAHAAWHALTLTSYQMRSVGTDDRAPRESVPTVTPSLTDLWDKQLAKRQEVELLDDPILTQDQIRGICQGWALASPRSSSECKHEGEKYTSVAGTTNCATCYKVLEQAPNRCTQCYRPAGSEHTHWCKDHPRYFDKPNPWGDA
mgnify:CR=1 FL=1